MPKKAKIVRFARSALVLKVTLQEVRLPIWRRLRVAGDLTLRELHHVLQIAMGWTDSHLHEFEIDDRRYGMPDAEEDLGKPALDELDHPLYRLLREGVRAEYVYDFGDGWRHEIVVEEAVTPEAGAAKAECLAGARACPPEDCGGDHGYAELLEAIADPSNERHEELREWVGPDFDPEAFDLAAVNRALRGAGSAAWPAELLFLVRSAARRDAIAEYSPVRGDLRTTEYRSRLARSLSTRRQPRFAMPRSSPSNCPPSPEPVRRPARP